MNDHALRELLSRDPLAIAEDLTGKSYKEDDQAMRLGVALAFTHGAAKREALQATRDTHHGTALQEYLEIVHEEGFRECLALPFKGTGWGDSCDETFYVFWHPDGVLLKFDTFNGDRVNGGDFLYNRVPNKPGWPSHQIISSGGFYELPDKTMVWIGGHDCREALRLNLRGLRENGRLLSPWVKRPFLWLLHYMDTKDPAYNYKAITEARIAMLPDDVRAAITPEAHS
jgi:hypothetical protein